MNYLVGLYALVFMGNGHVGVVERVGQFGSELSCRHERIRQNKEEPDIKGEVIWVSKKFRTKDQLQAGLYCKPIDDWRSLIKLTIKTDMSTTQD